MSEEAIQPSTRTPAPRSSEDLDEFVAGIPGRLICYAHKQQWRRRRKWFTLCALLVVVLVAAGALMWKTYGLEPLRNIPWDYTEWPIFRSGI